MSEISDIIEKQGYKIIKFVEKNYVVEKKEEYFFIKVAEYNNEVLINEAKVLNTFKSERISEMVDSFKNGSYNFLVLKYIKGKDLFDMREEIDKCKWAWILKELITTLKLLYSSEIYYNDLKLENIMIENGNVIIIDFGEYSCIETANKIGGTLLYNPPEMLSNNDYNIPKTNIWKLGIMMYTLFNKCHPFDNSIRDIYLHEKISRNMILNYQYHKFDEDIDIDVKDLILAMMCYYDCKRSTFDQILAHPFMKKYLTKENPFLV